MADNRVSEPTIIRPEMQRSTIDCAIACLTMLLGLPYADIAAKVRLRGRGLSGEQMRRAAKTLGRPLRWESRTTVEDLTQPAILVFRDTTTRDYHAVIWVSGTVYDPATGDWWTDDDIFLAHHTAEMVGALVRKVG